MIRILNKDLELQANIKKVITALVSEEINREYKFDFETVIDNEKSQYINHNHVAEIEGQYFDIAYYRKRHNQSGMFIQAECEHVSYRLNNEEYDLEFFTEDDTPQNILEKILEGTEFTAGTVEFTNQTVFSIQEETTRRNTLILFAEYLGGELEYNGFEISIVQQRGEDKGIQFKPDKNLRGIEQEVDARGELKIAYGVDLIELSELPKYKELGYADLEKVSLGEIVKVIDEDLDIEETQRVIKYEYNPVEKINSNVEIANFLEDSQDDITRIIRDTVAKEKVYNGIRIGPDNGFEAIRSDKKARTVMNATEGIKIQQGDGEGNYVDKFYADTEGNLNLEGNIIMNGGSISWDDVNSDPAIDEGVDEAKSVAESIADGTYSGGTFLDGTTIYAPLLAGATVQAGDFIGGTIDIGNGEFEVLNNGSMYATNAYIEGDIQSSNIYGSYIEGAEIVGANITSNSEIDIATDAYIGDYLFLGGQNYAGYKGISFATGTYESYIELANDVLRVESWGDLNLIADGTLDMLYDELDMGSNSPISTTRIYGDVNISGDTILDNDTWVGSVSSDNLVARMQDIPDTDNFTQPYYQSNYCYVDAGAGGLTIRDSNGNILGNLWYD